jgi:CRP-like cAMP-binding protein
MQTISRVAPSRGAALAANAGSLYWPGKGNSGSAIHPGEPDFQGSFTRSYNKVLTMLSPEAWARIEPQGRRVLLHQNQTLHERGAMPEYVYFVERGMVSLLVCAEDGAQVEACIVGQEGMVGAPSVLGDQPALHQAIVQVPGKAFRLPTRVLRDEWQRDAAFQEWSLRYSHLMLAHTSQGVLCNRIHSIEERLCRWLLTVRDRIESNELELTHEFIAHMLGARRSGVTMALRALQHRNLIECGRGRILIINNKQLEECACECYAQIAQSYRAYEDFMNRLHTAR